MMPNPLLILILSFGVVIPGGQSDHINPTGTYILDEVTREEANEIYGYFGQIQIKALNKEEIAMTFMICNGAPNYQTGIFVDTLAYHDNQTFYTSPESNPECRIEFEFLYDGLQIKKDSSNTGMQCGFDEDVLPHGYFRKISSDQPVLRHPRSEKIIDNQ